MMRLNVRMLICFLIIFILCSPNTYASSYDISDIKLNNVVVPKSFGICTVDRCDSEFSDILKSHDYTYEYWVEKIMKPDNIYFYASNWDEENIYIKGERLFKSSSDLKSGSNYKYDFNLAEDEMSRREMIEDYKRFLSGRIDDAELEMTYIPADEDSPTCYIASKYKSGGLWVYEYYTIYAGIKWTYYMSSPRKLTEENHQILDKLVRGVKYGYDVDYSDIERSLVDEEADENEDNTKYSDSKDGRIIFLITTITIAFLIIYIITDKQRKTF